MNTYLSWAVLLLTAALLSALALAATGTAIRRRSPTWLEVPRVNTLLLIGASLGTAPVLLAGTTSALGANIEPGIGNWLVLPALVAGLGLLPWNGLPSTEDDRLLFPALAAGMVGILEMAWVLPDLRPGVAAAAAVTALLRSRGERARVLRVAFVGLAAAVVAAMLAQVPALTGWLALPLLLGAAGAAVGLWLSRRASTSTRSISPPLAPLAGAFVGALAAMELFITIGQGAAVALWPAATGVLVAATALLAWNPELPEHLHRGERELWGKVAITLVLATAFAAVSALDVLAALALAGGALIVWVALRLAGRQRTAAIAGWRPSRSNLILYAAGSLTVASLCATSGVSWMLPIVHNRYGSAAPLLTEIPPAGSAIGLLITPLLARWLTPARTIVGSFTIMAAAFGVLVLLPPLPIALGASLVIGLVAVGIGSVHAAAPQRAKVRPVAASSVINGVFSIGTMVGSYGVARIAASLGASLGFAFLSAITISAAAGGWLLFGQRRISVPAEVELPLPSVTQEATPVERRSGLRGIWSKKLVAIAFLAATSKIPVGAALIPLATVLVGSKIFADPIWLAVVNSTAVIAGIVMMTTWRRKSVRWSDNGLLLAAAINLVAAVVLIPTLGQPGLLWMAATVLGFLGFYIGASYEQGAYAAIHDPQGGQKTIVNFGIAAGFTAGVYLGNWVVNSLHTMPVVVAIPAAAFSLVVTLLARPLVRKWVAEARKAEAEAASTTA